MAKVLIVDDSIIMRNNLEYLLTKEGHKVVGKAMNGKEGVALYKELLPDLVTMDISMPVLNGVDAVSQIINFNPGAKIIMISALNQKQMLFEAIKKGAKHYIIKPLETQEAIKIVNKVLTQSNVLEKEEKKQTKETSKDLHSSFEIKNVNGTFIISITSEMDEETIHALDLTLQGLIFVKPLHIIFDFGGLEDIGEKLYLFIQSMSLKMSQAGADLAYKMESETLKNKFKV